MDELAQLGSLDSEDNGLDIQDVTNFIAAHLAVNDAP